MNLENRYILLAIPVFVVLSTIAIMSFLPLTANEAMRIALTSPPMSVNRIDAAKRLDKLSNAQFAELLDSMLSQYDPVNGAAIFQIFQDRVKYGFVDDMGMSGYKWFVKNNEAGSEALTWPSEFISDSDQLLDAFLVLYDYWDEYENYHLTAFYLYDPTRFEDYSHRNLFDDSRFFEEVEVEVLRRH